MKTNLLFALVFLLAHSLAFANSWKFNCSVEGDKDRSVVISPSNDEYPLEALFKYKGSVTKLVGDKDVERDEEGNMVEIIRLVDPANYNKQLILQYTESVGHKVWAEKIDLQSEESESFQCNLESFDK
ncbi:hypothetical protein [Bdellovibrio sp. HCB209]|uniref:hypothetical protein n=1 Tax=Bdellovibrio sp. HCB209 TaxID=3394354 RepID=UPI0039B45580